MFRLLFALVLMISEFIFSTSAAEVGPVPDAVRREFKLAPFYQKHLDAGSLPVVGSTNVSLEKPRASIQTELGEIEIELDARRAPLTTANFLRYALEGFYSDGVFHRTVTLSNQPSSPVKIHAAPADGQTLTPPIRIQRAIRMK